MGRVVEITRVEEGEAGTFGVLRVDKQLVCFTLEPRDMFNAQNVSCIPAQQYHCARVHSPRFGETFGVMDVPKREHILFHPGNVATDTQGCILVGSRVGALRGIRGVLDSGEAFREFMGLLQGQDRFHLTVVAHY